MLPFLLQNENPERKTSSIAHFLAQQIVQLCQCQYSDSYITDAQAFCTAKDAVIYQAVLLSTDEKTALEIRNNTQQWVLSKPVLVIEQQFYEVDPYCSVMVEELGTTTCDTTEGLSKSSSAVSLIELVSVAGAGVMLILVIALIFILLCCCCKNKRKSKSVDIR